MMKAFHQPLDYFLWEISYANLVLLQLDGVSTIYKDKDGKLPGANGDGSLKGLIDALQKKQGTSDKEKEANEAIAAALARRRAKDEALANERANQEERPNPDNGEEVLGETSAPHQEGDDSESTQNGE